MQQHIRNSIHGRVMDHVSTHSPRSKYLFLAEKFCGAVLVALSAVIALYSLSFFAQTAIVSSNFNEYIGTSLSGLIWMWLPETLLVAAISLLTFFAGYKFLNITNISASMITTSLGYMCMMLLFVFVPTANVFADDGMYESFISTDYRLSMRDTYITEELDSSREYFGVVDNVSCQRGNSEQVTINHGGVLKRFEDPSNILCNSTKTGDLIWVRYDVNQMITDGKVL